MTLSHRMTSKRAVASVGIGAGILLGAVFVVDAFAWLYPPKVMPEQAVTDEDLVRNLYCATLNAEQQRWCEYHLDYNDYRDGRSEHCDWHNEQSNLYSCKFSGTPVERGSWYVNRVGPFTTNERVWFQAFERWADEFMMPGVFDRKVTASIVSLVDKEGNIVGDASARLSHVDPLAQDVTFSETPEMFPPGFGRNAVPRYFVDVLPESSVDEFYVEASILVTEQHIKLEPVTSLTITDLWGQLSVDTHQAMTWTVWEAPHSMELLWWKWYTNEFWVVVGDGNEIFGLDDDPYVLADSVPVSRVAQFESSRTSPATQRYLDLSRSPFEAIEDAQDDLLESYREYNKRQLLTGREPAEFLLKDVEQIDDRRQPSRTVIERGTKLTFIVFHRDANRNERPARLDVVDVATVRVIDPVHSTMDSPNGQYLLYTFKYDPFRFGCLVLLFVVAVGSISYYLAGCIVAAPDHEIEHEDKSDYVAPPILTKDDVEA